MILPIIRISWPDAALWKNRKSHWAVEKRSRDAQREQAFFIAKAAGWAKPVHPVREIHMTMTFCARTRVSRFDLDGALTACKGAVDGLSACLGVDDSLFTYTLRRGEKSRDGGVLIEAEIQ